MESDRTPTNVAGLYVPAPPDTRAYSELGTFAVDGETFAVRRSDDGAIHYHWISGPNEGYGFDTFGSSEPLGHHEHIASIREFLTGIDPATGYLSDL